MAPFDGAQMYFADQVVVGWDVTGTEGLLQRLLMQQVT